jgi:hypothetical protein
MRPSGDAAILSHPLPGEPVEGLAQPVELDLVGRGRCPLDQPKHQVGDGPRCERHHQVKRSVQPAAKTGQLAPRGIDGAAAAVAGGGRA